MSHIKGGKMSHLCKCECKHKNVKYCKKCDKVYCLDCRKEWPESRGYTWYYPQRYDYGTASLPYEVTWTDATTGITESGSCEMTYGSSPHQIELSGNIEGCGSHPDFN